MIGIDLFAGAGGMTLGAKQAGIDVRFAVENDPYAAATYRQNHPEVELLEEDICTIEHLPVEKKGHQLVLFGGPPCQGFSTSNQRTRGASNPRNWMFKQFLRFVELLKPEWVVFENVKGIVETENGLFLEAIKSDLRAADYTLSAFVLNAAKYGVPQRRERLFIIGSLDGIICAPPQPATKKAIPVRFALDDLPVLENGSSVNVRPYKSRAQNKYAAKLRGELDESTGHLVTRNAHYIIERYSHIPQGHNWEAIPEHLMANYKDRNNCHTGIYHRLDPDKPSIVIGNYRKNMLVHPFQNRGLSVREAARIQSFPDWYNFEGSIGFQQQQVGNAVPPLLSERVFTSITEHNG